VLKSREPAYQGRKGSDELPAFMLGKQAIPVPVVAAVAVGTAGAASDVTGSPNDVADAADEDSSPAPDPAATGPTANAGPDDAAIEAARKRRTDRRGKRGRS